MNNEEQKMDFSGVSHYTKVDVHPGGMNVQYVDKLYQADFLKAVGMEEDVKKLVTDSQAATPSEQKAAAMKTDVELFHFIHPSIIDDKEQQHIHCEVANLVSRFSLPEICDHLNRMAKAGRLLLPQSPDSIMTELQRLGMPGEETKGFGAKNFSKYYKK